MKIGHWCKKENSGLLRTALEFCHWEERLGHEVFIQEPSGEKPFYGTNGVVDVHAVHSQLAENKNVYCAGAFLLENGEIKRLDPGSGHYRPSREHLKYARLVFLEYSIPVSEDVLDFELFERYQGSFFANKNRYFREVVKVIQIATGNHNMPDEPPHLVGFIPN